MSQIKRFRKTYVRTTSERDYDLRWYNLSYDPRFRANPFAYRHWVAERFRGYYDYTLDGKINERGGLIIR